MKNRYFAIAFAALSLLSCKGWLNEDGPMVNRVGDYFTGPESALQVVTAAYTPLMWEYQNTYFSEWFIGDIASELKFADPFYFSRKFTALIGVPPSEYRRANRIGV